jgi:hypothetical protein
VCASTCVSCQPPSAVVTCTTHASLRLPSSARTYWSSALSVASPPASATAVAVAWAADVCGATGAGAGWFTERSPRVMMLPSLAIARLMMARLMLTLFAVCWK